MRRSRRIQFAGPRSQLAGAIDEPADRPARDWALMAHGFGSSRDFKPLVVIAGELAERGWGVLRLDFAGLGQSRGKFAETSFLTNRKDLLAAADYLRQQHGPPRLLVGHSLGGAALLSVASQLTEAERAATINAPGSLRPLVDTIVKMHPRLASQDAEIDIAGRPRLVTQAMLDVLRHFDLEPLLRQLTARLLVLHARHDDIVGYEHAQLICHLADQPAALRPLPEADHYLSDPRHARQVAAAIADWASCSAENNTDVTLLVLDGLEDEEEDEDELSGEHHRCAQPSVCSDVVCGYFVKIGKMPQRGGFRCISTLPSLTF